MVADTIFSVDNIGLRMCIREAMRYKSCTGVNYWHDKLQCKLLSWDQSISNLIVSLDDQLIDSPGHVYTDIDSWTMGGTPSSNTGPTKAAEGSYYMYTEMSGKAIGSRAVLTTESASLTVSYEGPAGYIKVFAGDKTSSLTSIWEKSGVQPNPDQWKNVTIEIPQFNNPVITIEVTRGDSFRGDIAIDDLILTPGR
ncbi:unnamed protein product [Mytilus edulis]|uniref:MAM domain-containing protein n=1 Tax=Mytilus edulis TaxID=6550 RepID=A0A8S3QZX9_MYTED|nr:unnamed protein product [Mytilus edulis]